ncbi:MAG: phenylalanine--tRNA ligase subunit beta [Endomicrobium sp.]|jgi:phenylalanyl-tRNA synthetase beta chain|nr:phenylalanine--tRNA ligase subunit beta [Endomicrobium sp.]
MKVSYNWLKKFVDFDLSPEALCSMLTSIGVETSVVSGGGAWTDVITAKVLTKEKHPNADKLSLCTLTDGINNYSVVCGAKNVEAGQIVPLAKIGAVLPGGFQIKKSKIRNVESEGMICSEQELGLKESSEGILVLDENTEIGVPLERVLESDSVLNVEITTNRGDCLSHLGVAREIGAKLKKTPLLPAVKTLDVAELSIVKVESDLCPRYIGAVISGVKVGPSPKWMSDALEKCGVRSINNIVDITNYVMLELGHPLHAFDMSKLSSKKVIVRTASENEPMTALDGKTYKLDAEMLVIADEAKPVAIAGVMGGEYSGIDENTETIFLESAIFKPSSVRKTSKKLNLSSDSSYRFERGAAWDIAELASWRAANLIYDIAGGRIETREDIKTAEYEKTNIALRVPRVSKLLGYTVEENRIAEILRFLGIDLKSGGKEIIICSIPSWRNDIKEEVDLIEEIARIYGYDNIPNPHGQALRISTKSNSFFPEIVSDFRSKLSGLGFCEALNYSFSEIKDLEFFGLKYFHKIANPISKENEVLRPSLLPSLYRNLMLNASQGADRVALFEYGKIYAENGERKTFAAIMYGNVWQEWWKWAEKKINPKYDFYFGGGIIRNILPDGFTITENLSPKSYFHPGKTAAAVYRGKPAGQFGILKPSLNGDLKDDIFYFEIDIESLESVYGGEVSLYGHYSKFPSVKRDISVTADKSLQFAKIEKAVKNVMKTGNILKEYSLFSVYDDESKLGAGKISYSFRLTYRNNDRTLTDEEVNSDMNALLEKLDGELSVKLRT